MIPGSRGRTLLAIVPLAFLGVFFLWPLVSILATGLAPDGSIDLSPFGTVFSTGSLAGIIWFTLWQATASTALTLAVALPGAYVVARYRFPGRNAVRALATIPFVLPTVVVGTAFLALVGPNGLTGIDLSGTIWAILAAHLFFNYAVVLRTVGGLWAHLDPRLEEAARSLGAGRFQVFRRVTLPLLRPAIAAAASIVFLFSFTSFGVVLILGGPGLSTLEVEIYRRTAVLFDLPIAAALAVIQLVGVGAILLAYSRYQERRATEMHLLPATETARPPRTARERVVVGATLASMAVILGGPLLVLIERSLRGPAGYGLQYYRALDDPGRTGALIADPIASIGNSLGFAAAATGIALIVGLTAAIVIAGKGRFSRWFDALLMLPLGTSAVTVGFGFLVALDWPVDLRASLLLVPIAHALVATPFVIRTVLPVLRAVRTRLREAAATLGATPRRVWREIDLPLITRATAAGAGFAAAISLGEFGATVLIARPATVTIPVAVFRFLGRPGDLNFGRAMAMSVILMAVTALAVMMVDRLRLPGSEEF